MDCASAMTVDPPFPWLGGKSRLAENINILLPKPNRELTYVEPFFGAGAIFFSRRPCGVEVINDKNEEIVNFFRVLREDGEALVRYLQNVPYSRSVFYEWRKPTATDLSPLERAARFFYVARSAFAGQATGRIPSWAYARSLDNKAKVVANAVDTELLRVRDRLRNAYIEHGDAASVIERFDSENSVFYCDPPYVMKTRSNGGYTHEMSDADHGQLLDVLKKVRGFVAISGYPNALYADLLERDGWEWRDFPLRCKTNQSSQRRDWQDMDRIERVWLNPRLAQWNHDQASRVQTLDLFEDGAA